MKKVLVVEDNEINRKLIREMLTHGGYEVDEAASGREGIELARSWAPDLILMDIQLPGMDGISTMKRIREMPEYCNTPILALTSYAMAGDHERFVSEGFTGYIPKPVRVTDLLETLGRYLS